MSVAATARGIDERGLGVLYARSEGDVRGYVRSGVEAPEAVIEDACQFAWCRLVHHRERVNVDGAVAWVVVTAVREAVKLARRARRELSLEALMEETGDLQLSRTAPSAHDALAPRLRLELIESLPERRRRLVWLQALGFKYPEIAMQAGETERSVERQLTKARASLYLAEAEADPDADAEAAADADADADAD